MHLTNKEWQIIVSALHVAQEVYDNDARQFRNHSTGEYSRTAEQFLKQRDEARQLGEKLSDNLGF